MSNFAIAYFALLGGFALVILALMVGIAWLLVTLPRRPQALEAPRAFFYAPAHRIVDPEWVFAQREDEEDPFPINPATGLPMLLGPHGIDFAGNPYGSDLASVDAHYRDFLGSYGDALHDLPSLPWPPLLDDGVVSNPFQAWDASTGIESSTGMDDTFNLGSGHHDA